MKRLFALIGALLLMATSAHAWTWGGNYGTNLVPSTPAAGSGWYLNNGATVTTGTSVNGLPAPAVVASGGSVFADREYFATPTFTAGVPLLTQFWFSYGTSNSFYIIINDGLFGVRVTVTGNTATYTQCGTVNFVVNQGCSAPIVQDYGAYKILSFVWVPAQTAQLNPGAGPNSATSGQTVNFYQMSVQERM